MRRKRISEADLLNPVYERVQRNSSEYTQVLLVLTLCLLAVSIFSAKFHQIRKHIAPVQTDDKGKYFWITGSKNLADGLYLLPPDKLRRNFPELVRFLSDNTLLPKTDTAIHAVQYETNMPRRIKLPPAIANIFFLPISINRADKEILSTLPGIGPVLSDRIDMQRKTQGPFKSVDELINIQGLGPKKLARIKKYISLD
jgi:hypothetical protein